MIRDNGLGYFLGATLYYRVRRPWHGQVIHTHVSLSPSSTICYQLGGKQAHRATHWPRVSMIQ